MALVVRHIITLNHNTKIMTLSEIKTILSTTGNLEFKLPSGEMVPVNFHVTEVGKISKHFIDCGGVVRKEEKVNFQLWEDAADIDHRLKPKKLLDIINLSQEKLGIGDHEIEVEYQSDTIGKYGLSYNGSQFVLVSTQTDCLAKDNCGVPTFKSLEFASTTSSESCTPGSGCC